MNSHFHPFLSLCYQLTMTSYLHVFVGSFDPHLLVFLAYSLAVAECFPEVLVKEIFRIDFLGKLDSQLESMSTFENIFSLCISHKVLIRHYILQPYLIHSTCGPGCASWSSTAPCVLSVLSSRCRGFMTITANSCKRKVKRRTMVFCC